MDARRPTPDCDAATAEIAGVEIAGERRKTGGKAARLTRLKKTGGFSRDFLCRLLLNPADNCSYFLRISCADFFTRHAVRRLGEFDDVIWTRGWGETS